ncbi:MAG: zinc ABC transporter substrate-binding protein [Gammaproteobacteria bacterium]|jgi:zinc transport system substrate-binding protein
MRRLLLLLGLWLAAPFASAAPLQVVVSILPQAYFVQQIAGTHARVSVMVRPGFEPATYDPTPRQLIELSRARLYFSIGVPFERAWLPRFRSEHPQLRIVDTSKGIQRLPMAGDHADDADRGLDPHIWLSPPLVRIQAMNIRDALIAADPAHAADYRHGYARLAETINRVDDDILHTLAGADLRHNRFMVFHPAFGYFAKAYGLQQLTVEQEGKEPSPRQLAALIDTAKREHIKVVFVEPQFSRKAAGSIASAIGGKVVVIDPLAEDWPAGMKAIARALRETLSPAGGQSD